MGPAVNVVGEGVVGAGVVGVSDGIGVVGTGVGTGAGAGVGVLDGTAEVGREVVGTPEGIHVGATVGAQEGPCVGASVGASEGPGVGASAVGAKDGTAELGIGDGAGLMVGNVSL